MYYPNWEGILLYSQSVAHHILCVSTVYEFFVYSPRHSDFNKALLYPISAEDRADLGFPT